MDSPPSNPTVTAVELLDRGFRHEQAGALRRALELYHAALASSVTLKGRADVHLRIARIYRSMTKWEESRHESSEAIRLADEAADDDLAAEAMNVEVGALQMQGFFDAADTIAIRALERARTPRVRGITLQNLGRGAAERRDFAASDRYFIDSIDAFRSANYEVGLAVALGNAARVALLQDDPKRAIELGDETIALARQLNALDILLTAVQNQAAALAAIGQHESATALLTEALGHFTSSGNLVRQAECLEIMGEMNQLRPDGRETAMRCYARAFALATEANDRPLIDRLSKRLGREPA